MPYSSRFEQALVLASALHRDQNRKGTDIPYITHLLGVAAIVGDCGGSEDQVIAALLHDAIEDQIAQRPDLPEELSQSFGAEVLRLILACSDADTHPKPPWLDRKQGYIDHLRELPRGDEALLVSLADKLYNALTLLRDAHVHGATHWQRFNATPAQTLWFHRELAAIFLAHDWQEPKQRALAESFDELGDALEQVMREHDLL